MICPLPSNHVGTVRGSFETIPAGPDNCPDAETSPPALRDCRPIRESSIDVQPSAYIPSRTSPPTSAWGPGTLGSSGPSSRMYRWEPGQRVVVEAWAPPYSLMRPALITDDMCPGLFGMQMLASSIPGEWQHCAGLRRARKHLIL
jgi:hypothetical protein